MLFEIHSTHRSTQQYPSSRESAFPKGYLFRTRQGKLFSHLSSPVRSMGWMCTRLSTIQALRLTRTMVKQRVSTIERHFRPLSLHYAALGSHLGGCLLVIFQRQVLGGWKFLARSHPDVFRHPSVLSSQACFSVISRHLVVDVAAVFSRRMPSNPSWNYLGGLADHLSHFPFTIPHFLSPSSSRARCPGKIILRTVVVF
jgi:hypothetical protein